MKRFVASFMLLLLLMSVTACKVTKEREDAHQFKEEYEALNEKEKDGKA